VPCSASLSLPKSGPRKTMPLVFMTRGEREARSSKFYPGALRIARQNESAGAADRPPFYLAETWDVTQLAN
jgi:hypothetical protein